MHPYRPIVSAGASKRACTGAYIQQIAEAMTAHGYLMATELGTKH
jgi:hypothetical protein